VAILHAHQAIMIVQSTLLHNFLPHKERTSVNSTKMEKEFKDRIAVLAIAYHNLGVEQEYLK
jgi:hypothetical protein